MARWVTLTDAKRMVPITVNTERVDALLHRPFTGSGYAHQGEGTRIYCTDRIFDVVQTPDEIIRLVNR